MEECDDESWDQRSDFSKLSHAGYRYAILDDFQEAENGGRISGYSKGIDTSFNPTIFLARLNGLIMACLLKQTLSKEEEEEARSIHKEVKKALTSNSEPGCDPNEISCTEITALEGATAFSENSKTHQNFGALSNESSCTESALSNENTCAEGATCCSKIGEMQKCGTLVDESTKTKGATSCSKSIDTYQVIFARTKAFCERVGWKIPDRLILE